MCDLTVGGRRDMMAVVMVAMGAVVVAFLSGSGVGGSEVIEQERLLNAPDGGWIQNGVMVGHGESHVPDNHPVRTLLLQIGGLAAHPNAAMLWRLQFGNALPTMLRCFQTRRLLGSGGLPAIWQLAARD